MWLGIAALLMVAALAALWIAITQPLYVATVKQWPPEVKPARLESHVRMLSETMTPRDYRHPENLDRAAAWIRGELAATKARLSEQAFTAEGRTYRNVIARFGPEEGELIVIGAHYDVCMPYPGADDNASGVAGLLELARLFDQAPPRAPVELVAYTLEEPPFFRSELMGSAMHARSLRERGARVRAMFSLEMIGYFSDAPGSQDFPSPALRLLYPATGNFIAVVGDFGQIGLVREVKGAMRRADTIPVYSINAPGWLPGIDFSDHLNYWNAGYPAVMITDTSFYRNKNYHTPQDTADKLDYNRMAGVVQAVFAAVQAFAPVD